MQNGHRFCWRCWAVSYHAPQLCKNKFGVSVTAYRILNRSFIKGISICGGKTGFFLLQSSVCFNSCAFYYPLESSSALQIKEPCAQGQTGARVPSWTSGSRAWGSAKAAAQQSSCTHFLCNAHRGFTCQAGNEITASSHNGYRLGTLWYNRNTKDELFLADLLRREKKGGWGGRGKNSKLCISGSSLYIPGEKRHTVTTPN